MKEAEFRAWLEARGVTDKARNTRTYAVRTIEKNLAALGCSHFTLDEAFNADAFAGLRDILKQVAADASENGTRFRILMPQSENPIARLQNWRSWLGQYGKFLSGAEIDNEAATTDEMMVEGEWLTLLDAAGVAYRPRQERNLQTGQSAYRIKPAGASNETAAAIETNDVVQVARALLLDGLPVRIVAEHSSTASYLKFPGKMVSYRLNPDIAAALGLPADSAQTAGVSQEIATSSLDNGPYWFVGAAFGRKDDQFDRFIREGIWEIDSPTDRHREQVRRMEPGQRIAIKATYVRKNGLPFDTRGRIISVMAIKAIAPSPPIPATASGCRSPGSR